MRPLPFLRPELVAGGYALLFAGSIYLSLRTGSNGFWFLLSFALTWPWSMALMLVASWAIVHGNYPMEYYLVPCALLNTICLFLLCRLDKRRIERQQPE